MWIAGRGSKGYGLHKRPRPEGEFPLFGFF